MTRSRAHSPVAAPRHPVLTTCTVLGLLAAVALVYERVGHFAFVDVDDVSNIVQNPYVARGLSGPDVLWALTSLQATHWVPLTWLSHMADCTLFGLTPGPPHLENAAWHAATVLLLYGLLRHLTGQAARSAVVAAIFAVHPLHVESVAWVTERKDVLSAFWGLVTLWAYVWFVDRRTPARYVALAASYAMGLMAKSMLVTWPFVMLLLDWWPLGRLAITERARDRASIGRLVVEKLPLVALAAIAGVLTVVAQQTRGAVIPLGVLPLHRRIENAVVSYVWYVSRLVWPVHLSPFYPWGPAPAAFTLVLACAALAGVTALVLWQARTRPYLVVGWLWFLGTLVPVIGLAQAGAQARADRYMYLPSIGLLIMAAWGLPELWARGRLGWGRPVAALAATASLIALAVAAHAQVTVWANSVRLWQRAVAVSPQSYRLHFYLASALDTAREFRPAVAAYGEAIRLAPQFVEGQDELSPRRSGPVPPAILDAVRASPQSAAAHRAYADALAEEGRQAEAAAQFEEAERLAPAEAGAYAGEGAVLAAQGELEWASAQYATALRLAPAHADWEYALAEVLIARGQPAAAVPHLEAALRLKPDFPAAGGLLRQIRSGGIGAS